MGKENEFSAECVEINAKDGVAFIEQVSPLTRLHYFDGKFLRADAFALEQDYHRTRTRLSNLAGGWGVVHGLGISLSGNRLDVGAGLAITAAGNFVLAMGEMGVDLADLLQVAAPAPLGGNAEFADCIEAPQAGVKEGAGLAIYEITVGPVDGLCGNEPVYGKLCESACVSDSQHPYWREGVVLRLRPIGLKLPSSSAVALSVTHLRNRIASGYFAAEPWLTPSALSASGLASDLWCNPASLYGRDEVVIGLLAREGGVNRVIDAWSGRRERMDTQARGYWQGRMAMRPWNVFVAQILQFQCQLAGLFDGSGGVIKPADDCDQLRQLLDKTRKEIEVLHKKYAAGTRTILKQFGEKTLKKADAQLVANEVTASYAELYEISDQLSKAELGSGALPKKRLLLNGGFVELPPAGYLPVVAGKVRLEEQLARMFGEGVRLHYHAVRHDEIAHLVEEAQHLERISLTRGVDDAKLIEDVEIFVPDGEVYGVKQAAPGEWWQVEMAYAALAAFDLGLSGTENTLNVNSQAAREQILKEAASANLSIAKKTATKTAKSAPRKTGAIKTNALAINALDEGTLKEIQEKLRQLVRAVADRRVLGLARSEGRADGSYGFTLVGRLDVDDIVAEMRKLLDTYPEVDPNGLFRRQVEKYTQIAIYLAGDIAADPLDMALNGSTSVKGELAGGKLTVEISGTLTALFDRPAAGGGSERVAQLSLVAVRPDGKASSSRGRISLLRQGDGRDGRFVLDDASHDPSTSPNFFEWEDSPRTAAMYVLDADGTEMVGVKLMRGMTDYAKSTDTGAAADTATAGSSLNVNAVANAARKQLLKMDGLAGMPTLESALGAAAMTALIGLAEAADDPALFVRARRRLFPALDMPTTEGVRAVRDWVMFRRARTHLCCPRLPATPVKPALEAFQVWHVAVSSADELKMLQGALDGNDAKQLARFKLQRVGVLRYRDENTVAEEPETQVEAMWRNANPGARVVLGRYWEQTPTTGQGWQNHFRLRSMLDQISEITTPPARGDGVIARLEAVSPPLSDATMDGGLLLVTLGTAARLRPHRTILLPHTYYDNLKSVFEKNPDDAWQRIGEILLRDPAAVVDLSLGFDLGNRIDAASINLLQQGDAKMMSGRTDFGYQLWLRRIDAARIDAGTDPAARHKTVGDNVGKAALLADRFDDPTVKLAATDLGGGAQVASVVFYLSVVEIG